MKKQFIFLFAFLLALVGTSCKNESKSNDADGVSPTDTTQQRIVEKKTMTEAEKKVLNSVFSKIMATPELGKFASASVTSGLHEIISKEEGPFTVLAPTNDAFAALPQSKMKALLDPDQSEQLILLLKNHVVTGNFNSADLLQSIKKSGTFPLNTLGGAVLTARLKGTDIYIQDANGVEAKLGKTDILGGNGVVHLLEKVLNTN
ncbi:MAG TPA: fasciclin domain-containing protein [Flavobacteriaceae bacterium]|nr:fasciclin domain-containing protein [Flavobacteriaceae bacterium]MCB9213598.1 fasciclin domain-containing protein [Alteromonas sp.]HPF12099.1 fasciclin domain-containing protein [Flavobacteriaceae bacterium]HQU21470.1 fasciclin domain-containing protein [Flavobacteriaceae bacterium]HQU65620.1 fasciclin domain-containing protein [Flavobacteriaceae bacterium]